MKERKKKEEWVDDGRTIADMSGITRRNLLIPRPFSEELKEQEEEERARELHKDSPKRSASTVTDENGIISEPEEVYRRRPWEKASGPDRRETGWYILGTLAAGLSLVLLFIAAGGIIILLMLALWS